MKSLVFECVEVRRRDCGRGRRRREGREPLLLALLLVQASLLGLVQSENGTEDEMRCVCDGGCEHLREADCPWGLTLDVCACCFICARGENEPCGGALGTCAFGLRCEWAPVKNENETMSREGTCARKTGNCGEVEKKFGCVVQAGDCICQERSGCPDVEMPLLNQDDMRNSCRSRIAFLVARKDLELQSSSVPATGQ